jgi:tetratricopeptide (TPR) repeat protein
MKPSTPSVVSFFLYLFIHTVFSIPLNAQHAVIDSLEKVVQHQSTDDTTKINTLILLCTAYLNEKHSNKPKVAALLPEIIRLSNKLNYNTGKVHSYLYAEITNTKNTNYSQSIPIFLTALKKLEVVGNKSEIGLCYQYLALAYYSIGNYEASIQSNLLSVKIKMETGDRLSIANNYNNIGNDYLNLAKYQEALTYYLRSLKIKEEINDKAGVSRTLINIVSVFTFQGKLDQAFAY